MARHERAGKDVQLFWSEKSRAVPVPLASPWHATHRSGVWVHRTRTLDPLIKSQFHCAATIATG